MYLNKRIALASLALLLPIGICQAAPFVDVLDLPAQRSELAARSPLLDVASLGEMGYRLVLFPLTAFRAAMKAAEETLADLYRAGHQRASVPRMLTRQELYDLLGYTGYEARDRAYFGGAGDR